MKTKLLAFLFLVTPIQSAPPEPTHWRELLTQPVDEEWQQIFGVSLFQNRPRPAETVGEKLQAVQTLIAQSNKQGLTIPVFLPPALAAIRCDAIPAAPQDQTQTGSLILIPAMDLFRYVASRIGCDVIETEYGIIFKQRNQKQ